MVAYETPKRIRIEETIFAYLEFPLMVLGAIICGGFVGFFIWLFVNNLWVAIFFGLVVGIYFLRGAWKGFLGRLRFWIQFHPDHVQIGRKFASCRFPYKLVEMITIQRNHLKKTFYIEIECSKNEVQIYLPNESIAECVSLLCKSCNNAIYVDINGNEHLPPYSTQPDFTLKNLKNHYLSKIIAWSLGFVFALLLDFHFCTMLVSWIQGKPMGKELYFVIGVLVLSGSGSVASLIMLINYIKKLLHLSREMRKEKCDTICTNNKPISQ
jgi:hypothetical protein